MASPADLGVWRTPVERVPRLAAAVGLGADDLWVKRDDWLAVGGGGNKLRKLAHALAGAPEDGTTTVVTTGAAQSNHARLTAAAARRLGLEPVLVLRGDGGHGTVGNLALDAILGAEVVWAGDATADELDARAREVAREREAAGERVRLVPYGGSDGRSVHGYAACGREIDEDVEGVRHVVVAVGSGGTAAGLVLALGADRVLGVDAGAVPDARAAVARLVRAAGGQVDDDALRVRTDQVGDAYEATTDASARALTTAGRTAGLVLDPVYTAKALAGLAAAVQDGGIRPGERTVFVHTGGLPGLFGHPDAATLAASLG